MFLYGSANGNVCILHTGCCWWVRNIFGKDNESNVSMSLRAFTLKLISECKAYMVYRLWITKKGFFCDQL